MVSNQFKEATKNIQRNPNQQKNINCRNRNVCRQVYFSV